MKVYLVWLINKKTKSSTLIDIYENSEKALARVSAEKEKIHKNCETALYTCTIEMRYVLL